MVNGVAKLVEMCRNRSGLDELMVILDGMTMHARSSTLQRQNASYTNTLAP